MRLSPHLAAVIWALCVALAPVLPPCAAAGVPAVPAGMQVEVDRLGMSPTARAVSLASQELAQGHLVASQRALAGVHGPAADLLRARIWRRQAGAKADPPGTATDTGAALAAAASHPQVAPWAALERGLAASAAGSAAAAVGILWPLARAGGAVGAAALAPLLPLWAEHDPGGFLARLVTLASLLPAGDEALRGTFLASQAAAWQRLGAADLALARRRQLFFELPLWEPPIAPGRPLAPIPAARPPLDVAQTTTSELWLGRLEHLSAANRSAQVLREIEALPGPAWTGASACRLALLRGRAARRSRRWAAAEAALGEVVDSCPLGPWSRPAAYLRLRVAVLQGGLQALPAIETYARTWAGDPFVDDALFWAGDLLQRRGRPAEADAYYARIEALPTPDDYCAEARFRRGWLALKAGDLAAAEVHLGRLLAGDGCERGPHDRSRARYWLAWLASARGGDQAAARAAGQLRLLWQENPLSYYAQLALPRLLELLPTAERLALSRSLMLPLAHPSAPLCAADMTAQPGFGRALALLDLGLGPEAAAELIQLRVGGDGPLYAGLTAGGQPLSAADLGACGPAQAALLWARLMDRAGDWRRAHGLLRTAFAAPLRALPRPAEVAMWQAAYPLAFAPSVAAAELEAGLPRFLLHALCREESAFDPQAVSWAGAQGLSQLMPASARDVAGQLRPPVSLAAPGALWDPDLNLRLGARLLAGMLGRVGGHEALGLVSYNAGGTLARELWRRGRGVPLDIFVEDIPVEETRAYVKRVLRSYGVYRWLWGEALPSLPVDLHLPP